jgi:hypothetical protein
MAIDWSSLRHAYGPAEGIPALLAAAITADAPQDYREEPWFSLWSALYHQDDIYSASYAAVPELVAIADARRDGAGLEALFLAASIELRRNKIGAPAVPAQIEPEYAKALTRTARLIEEGGFIPQRAHDGRILKIAHAVFTGDFTRAEELLEPAEGEG